MTINGLSLFCCAGIGDLKLHENNINIIVANELLKERADIYSYNNPKCNTIIGSICNEKIQNDIISFSKNNNVQYIQATPPCQGFSTAGKMNENDPRNFLIIHTINVIKNIQPNWVLIENVPRFLKHFIKHNDIKYQVIDYIKKELPNYFLDYDILDTANYGLPQTRKRAILLLSKNNAPIKLTIPKQFEKVITVKDAIGHLPSLESGEKSNIPYHYVPKHNDKHILWMKHTPSGMSAFKNKIHYPSKDGRPIKAFQNTYKRIRWDKPAPTITTANGVISSQENVHPGRLLLDGTYSDARVLSILEILILTGIEKSFKIPPNISDKLIREVVGESLPPILPYVCTKGLKNDSI